MEIQNAVKRRTTCRVCGGSDLLLFLQLNEMPLANSYMDTKILAEAEARFPLEVYFCRDCRHCQLLHVIAPEVLYKDYLYVSSTSPTLRQHFSELADEVIGRQSIGPSDIVIEIASNDGVLLDELRRKGVRGIGIDPASNLVEVCRANGLEAEDQFFNFETAQRIGQKYGKAKAIIGCNVMGHVDQLVDFIKGAESLLTDDGLLSIEVPHLLQLIDHLEFDTVYHEHLSYFSVHSASVLFSQAGLTLYDVQQRPIHGGTIRLFGKKAATRVDISDEVQRLLALEEATGLDRFETFETFGKAVIAIRKELLTLLRAFKAQGKRVAGYGAAAKGATLLNYCDIDDSLLAYIVDKNPLKQGLFAPGSGLEIFPAEKILEDQPDYLLLLAWNFSEEIMSEQKEYSRRGGRFIMPLPLPHIVE